MPGVGTTHHIQLGGHYYLVKPGSYQKRVAPQFGARFTTGDPDYNNLSVWQHWAQGCWVGGVDAPLWTDDAMYDQGVGVDTTVHEQASLGRGLARGTGANWQLSAGTANSQGGKFVIYNNILYFASFAAGGTASHLWQYVPGTDGWTRITSLDAQAITIRSVATFDGKLFLGGATTAGATRLIYGSGALSSWTVMTPPAGETGAVRSMRAFQQKLYVAYNAHVWRLKDDQTWDGNTRFYKADLNSESNFITAMEVHLGFLYMLSFNGHVHRTDGNTTFDIWSWDGQTYGISIKSFDGRLFIVTFEYGATASVGRGVLYQMSGSAVTELKRWGDETAVTIISSLVVFARKLYYGASNLLGFGARRGFGIAAYDPIEDAHTIFASNSDTATYSPGASPYQNYAVDDVIAFGGRLYAHVWGHGAFQTPFRPPRDVQDGVARYDISAAGGGLTSTNGGWFTSSTYDAGTPGLRKLWRKVAIDYTLPAASTGMVLDYSTDNGVTWTTLGTITTVGTRVRQEFFLENKISVSFKLRLTLRSTDNTKSPILYGFLVSYLPVVEPNWLWTFTVVLSEKQALLDGTTQDVDTEAELAFLRDTYRTKQLVSFVDAEGTAWASAGQPGVLIYDMAELLRDLTQPLEGEVQLTLLEAVETY